MSGRHTGAEDSMCLSHNRLCRRGRTIESDDGTVTAFVIELRLGDETPCVRIAPSQQLASLNVVSDESLRHADTSLVRNDASTTMTSSMTRGADASASEQVAPLAAAAAAARNSGDRWRSDRSLLPPSECSTKQSVQKHMSCYAQLYTTFISILHVAIHVQNQ